MRTKDETLDLVIGQFNEADKAPAEKAKYMRKRAKMVFDAQFPNPDMCPTCKRKLSR